MRIAADSSVCDRSMRIVAGSDPQQGPGPTDAATVSQHTSPSIRLRILIVEDVSWIAMQLEDIVQKLGHEVVGSAASHAQAVASAETSRPDLALMDINLGCGRDGIETALELRCRFNVPCVFVSAYASHAEIKERARVAQPLGFVLKPYTHREIAAALKQAADQLR